MLERQKNILYLDETPLVLPEIDRVAALEIDLDEHQTFVVLAEDRLEESASAQNLLEDEVVRGRQVVEVVLRRRHLRRSSDFVPHREQTKKDF